MIKLQKDLNNNTIYYTIVSKKGLNFKTIKNTNERLETKQAKYILDCMLSQFGIKERSIYKTKLGKPYFRNINVFFNYSHSNNYIACAISNHNVGIDIEETNRIINNTMIKICDFEKGNELRELVKREAFCKLTGKGIAMFFDKNNFKNIDKKCTTIETKEYICTICGDCENPLFQSINIK